MDVHLVAPGVRAVPNTLLINYVLSLAPVSIDQMDSPSPGFIGQLKGALTTQRYQAATIFVDHYSKLSFVYLQQSTNADKTIKTKPAFESYAWHTAGIQIKHYHVDNGRFAETKWLDDIEKKNQTQSFCDVGAHYQNGIAEKEFKIYKKAQEQWCFMHHTNGPNHTQQHFGHTQYARLTKISTQHQNPIQPSYCQSIFPQTTSRPQLRHHRVYGCPLYVLKAKLQDGKSVGKMEPTSSNWHLSWPITKTRKISSSSSQPKEQD